MTGPDPGGWIPDLEADLARARAEVDALLETLAWARRLEATARRLEAPARLRPAAATNGRRGAVQVADVRDHLRLAGSLTVRQTADHFAISTATARARLDSLALAGTAAVTITDDHGSPRLYRFVAPAPAPETPRPVHTPGQGPRTVPLAPVAGTSKRAGVGRRVARARARRGRH